MYTSWKIRFLYKYKLNVLIKKIYILHWQFPACTWKQLKETLLLTITWTIYSNDHTYFTFNTKSIIVKIARVTSLRLVKRFCWPPSWCSLERYNPRFYSILFSSLLFPSLCLWGFIHHGLQKVGHSNMIPRKFEWHSETQTQISQSMCYFHILIDHTLPLL